MRALIVLAHPERKSFNGRLVDRAIEVLAGQGHEVEVSDLYMQQFDAREGPWHYAHRGDPSCFDVQAEQLRSSEQQVLPADVSLELARVERADLIIFQYPMWWFAPPAMMKGWIDRVLVYGRTYSSRMRFEKGGLAGKRAMVSVTLGGPESTFAHNGRNGDIDVLLWPMHTSLRYVGLDVLPAFKAFGIGVDASGDPGEQRRRKLLDAYAGRLNAWQDTEPLQFNSLSEWDENGQLKPEARSFSLVIRHHP